MLKMVASTEKNLVVLKEGARDFIRLVKPFDLINYVQELLSQNKKQGNIYSSVSLSFYF